MLVCHKNDGKDGDDDDGADYDDVDDGRKLHGLRTRAPVVWVLFLLGLLRGCCCFGETSMSDGADSEADEGSGSSEMERTPRDSPS